MASTTRVVVHEDDVGMNHGANAAFAELFELGVCTAGSVMVPCPWFLEVAEMQAKNPRLDIGVHLVLTSEFRTYRWRPLTGASQASGLVDADGYFWRTANEARAHAHPDAVEAELRAQVDAAKAAGIDITHIDAHMFTALGPDFVGIYTSLGRQERVPVLLVRQAAAYGSMQKGAAVNAAIDAADAEGLPVFDRVLETPWKRGASVEADYDALFDRLGPGLNYMALHFNQPGEIAWIEPGPKNIRTEEYAHFKSERIRERLAGYELIGMRGLRDELRRGPYAATKADSPGRRAAG
jgi:chitin disaccharide deacetylase